MEEYDISFICANCDVEIIAPNAYAGMDIECPECGVMLKVPIPGLESGLILGEFELVRRIGIGGMGEVWLAKQQTLNRMIALKILLPNLSNNERFVNRFLAEANMSGRLDHPNIITAYSAGCIGGFYYLATSFVDGVELNARLRIDHRIPEREALKTVKAVAFALRYAWDRHQMIHRDIKPANIMLDTHGTPRLLDFGISKIIDPQNSENIDNDICGTPEYVSPEQASGSSDIDFRSDIYSLGITIFQLISGFVPFRADSVMETLEMQRHAPFPDRNSFHSNISNQCYNLIEIMTQKDPDDRHSSWDYLISDLDLVLEGKMPAGKINRTTDIEKTYTVSAPSAKITMKRSRVAPGKRSFKAPSVQQAKSSKVEPAPTPMPKPKPGALIPPPPTILHSSYQSHKFLKWCLKLAIIAIAILGLIIIILKTILKR